MDTATLILFAIHSVIAIGFGIRVIMKRPAIGVALAWLVMLVALPYAGTVLYLLIGERRIGRRREQRIAAMRPDFHKIIALGVAQGRSNVDWSKHPPAARQLDVLGHRCAGCPTVKESDFVMYSNTAEILDAIARDIDQAERSVLMEFYIWNEGGKADEVLDAVIRAAERGVHCSVLIDAVGARPWWKGPQPEKLRKAGVEILPALPVGLFGTYFSRADLRLHRKIVVVDSDIAWTGSMNLVDPKFFKQDSGVGEWVDAMVRLQGSVVAPLAGTMIGDWILETGQSLPEMIQIAGLKFVEPQGNVDMQVVPSGPGETGDGLLQMILALLYAAEEEIVLTTPYLVPDESLLRAIRGACGRGVRVRLIIPEKVDSFLTRYASRSYFDDLLDIGVEVQLYRGGLLHTKSICVDQKMSMFGTVNLDMRSFWLNFEVALFVYSQDFAKQLHRLQQTYIDDSEPLDEETWKQRSFRERILENTLRLFSPLL